MDYNYDAPANDTSQRFHGRLCGENELCIGPQKCLPINPRTGLYDETFDVLDNCFHDPKWPGWRGWKGKVSSFCTILIII